MDLNSEAGVNVSGWGNSTDDDVNEELLRLDDALNLNTSSLRSDEKYCGFDNNAGDTWIFPSNFPERAYQYNIIQKALFHNTLVVLPTGLGKTFIAAVVMYNMYRWYPMGKVIFMAPTRPLVAQQIDACCKIMGIPKEHSVEITGKLSKASRFELWQSKRVFFATPQSVQSDMLDPEINFPFQAVKLIVVDEAHRAKGRYAYTEVLRYILSKNKFFRVLALSATPGRRKEDIEEVIRNLFISHIEVRTEDSVDVVSYVHKRQLKVVVVDLGTKLSQIRDELLQIADPHIRNLIENRLISGRASSISRNWLVMEHKRFREMTLNSGVPYQKELNSDFSICISVYHAIELLERHGLRVFLNNFDESQENGPKFVVILRPDLRRLIQRVREEAGPNPFAFSDQSMLDGQIAPIPPNIDFGHPKFEIAREHVLAHFESNKEARVIIFCEYRESVMLMHRLLLQHRPVIRPRLFVGQGGSGSIRAVTQQQQISVMNDFKSGKSNALIATSVAEEGIDVGEVDLIVCFDINTSNPTRFIQRIGRTGRKKEGKVLLLATEGKEHSMLRDVLSERNRLNKSISRGGQFSLAFYDQDSRMVPTEFNPKCMKLFIQAAEEEASTSKAKDKHNKTKKGNKFTQITQKKDMRHFFKQKVVLDEEDKVVFAETQSQPQIKSPIVTRKSPSPKQLPNIIPPDDAINFTIPASPLSTSNKNLPINNKMIKKMAKFVRNKTNTQPIETLKAMTSNKLSKNSFQFLIEFSSDVLPHIWDRMQDLWNRGIDENKIPQRGITNEDRQIIRAYLEVVNNLGSKESVKELVESKQKLPKRPSCSNLRNEFQSIFADLQQGGICENNFEFLVDRFAEISNNLPSCDSDKDSYVMSMVYEDKHDYSTSVLNESSHNYSNDYILDSKYMSQWGEEINHTRSTSPQLAPEFPKPDFSNINQNQVNVPATENHSDDDDVVFVGTSHQSTPIRSGLHKQPLLNFNSTPIINSSSKRKTKQMTPIRRKNQKNILDFVKLNKVQNIDSKTSEMELPKPTVLEELEENTEHFFDDQFDAIIAANSGALEQIENINKVNFNCETNPVKSSSETANKAPSNSDKSPENLVKITPTLGSNDTTPDDVDTQIEKRLIETINTPAEVSSATNHLQNDQISGSKSKSSEEIHPELADIDINDLSEFSIEEIERQSDSAPKTSKSSPNRGSPDIFDELFESTTESNAKEKSPIRIVNNCPPTEVSPCLITKKTLTWGQIREKYMKSSQLDSNKTVELPSNHAPNCTTKETSNAYESPINVPSKSRLKRRIIQSDTESSDNDIKDSSPVRKRRRNIQKMHDEIIRANLKQSRIRIQEKRRNNFIDDEADLSGSATEDECDHTIGQYIQDSVIVDDDEVENESSIPMTGIYLQSVRSPCNKIRGGFKIPEPRIYNDASNIFSQQVQPDNYEKDSFVVISDDESDVEKSMCPLERAEEILKKRRRAKRKAKMDDGNIREQLVQPAKKKRVLRIHNSSEDDDFA